MKTGKTLVELATEIERQRRTKKDMLVNVGLADHVRAVVDDRGAPTLVVDGEVFHMTDLCRRQLGEHYGIPAKYFDRMQAEQPQLLAENINTWMHAKQEVRMLRTLDGRARAFLSDKYRPLDNFDLAEAVLPIIADLGVELLSCDITETNMYIKAVDKRILRDVPAGKKIGDGSHTFFDTLSPAITIRNSDVGMGALSVDTSVFTKMCTNLATMDKKGSLRTYHVSGKGVDLGDEIYTLLSEKTRRLNDAALWSKIRDIVRNAFDKARFEALVDEKIKPMAEQDIPGDPVKVIDLTARRLMLSDDEKSSVLQHLIRGGELTRYGLFNAITRTAQDIESYDRATEVEALGGKVVELTRNEWQQLAHAA